MTLGVVMHCVRATHVYARDPLISGNFEPLQAFTRRHVPRVTCHQLTPTGTIVVPAFRGVDGYHPRPDRTSRSHVIPENASTHILTD